MVSFINSIFDEFGSGVVVPGTGFVLHDRGLGFTMDAGTAEHRGAGQASVPHAHSRVRHQAGPTQRADGTGDEPYMSFGLMGGAMQAQGHAQFLINMLVFGMNVQEAMDAGRFRHENGARVIVEPAIADSVIAQLKAMGHEVSVRAPIAVRREPGDHQAAARLRRRVRSAKGRTRGRLLTLPATAFPAREPDHRTRSRRAVHALATRRRTSRRGHRQLPRLDARRVRFLPRRVRADGDRQGVRRDPTRRSRSSITLTLAFRPVGAFIFGLMADRYGRRIPLMIDLVFYSVVEVATGFAPNYTTFLVLRALFGIGMGGEWGVGASLAMEKAPAHRRGILSGLLQEGYALGYLLAARLLLLRVPALGLAADVLPRRTAGAARALRALAREGVGGVGAHARARLGRVPRARSRRTGSCSSISSFLMTMMNFVSHGTQDMYPTFLQARLAFHAAAERASLTA